MQSLRSPRHLAFFFVKIGFIAAIFVLIFRPETFGFEPDLFQDITPASLWATLRELSLAQAVPWLLFAVVVKLAGIFAGVMRWRLLLRGQRIHIPLWYLVKCWFMGRAIGLWLPGTLGLDGYRLVESSRYTAEPIKCTTVIAVEKLTGFIALFTLVFLTVPLGLRLFPINLVLLGLVLAFLAAFIAFSLILLLNPRSIQILAMATPVPERVRDQVNRLGAAATAYSGRAGTLLAALGLGLCVHLGTCLMYFGTASAVAAANTGILDILFASPLIIVGSVFTPTVSGLGVREVVMTTLLGGTAGADAALLFGHLGLWAGEVVPFVLSVPLLLFTTRPDRDQLLADARAAREAAVEDLRQLPVLTTSEVAEYRRKLLTAGLAGLAGGLIAGTVLGIAEAAWLMAQAGGKDLGGFWWGPLFYGLVFAGAGLCGGLALAMLYLAARRFASGAVTFSLSLACCLLAGLLVIGFFVYQRDVLGGHGMTQGDAARVLGTAAGGALAALVLGLAVTFPLRRLSLGKGLIVAVVVYVLTVGIGFGAASAGIGAPSSGYDALYRDGERLALESNTGGANILLIVADTLRADHLPMYDADAPYPTPALSSLAEDGIVFTEAVAQSSWTKPSFATLHTGMYPSGHTAIYKQRKLPEELTTVAEELFIRGYFTWGMSNNPNTTSGFNYDQGFMTYLDLEPSLYFGASPSAAKMTIYQVLRRVYQRVQDRLTGGRINVEDFYQPAPVVTDTFLDFLEDRNAEHRFYALLHYMDPHDPFMDHTQDGVGYARARLGEPDPEMADTLRAAYATEIPYMDEHIGRVFDAMKEAGIYEDSMIIFTSDHGEEFYDHGGWWHGRTLYEEQIHVPLIVKLPGSKHAGAVDDRLVRHVDLPSTILRVADITTRAEWPADAPGDPLPLPDAMEGIPLFGDGLDPRNATIQHAYAETDHEGNQVEAVRTLTHKYVEANEGNPRGLPPVALYELPDEATNHAGEMTYVQDELDATLDGYREGTAESAVEAEQAELTPEERQRLQDLGYGGE